MEHYSKGDVRMVETPPVFMLDDSGVEMRVNAGSKIRNLLGFGMKKIREPGVKQLTWNGSGNAMNKAISCAEIMKRKIKGLHQVNKIYYRRVEEFWEPNVEGLERLKVNRDVPAISILLSKDPVDTTELGYQPPGYNEDFWKADLGTDKQTPEKSSQGNSKGSNSKKNEKKRKNDYRKSQYDKQKVKKDSLSEKSVQT